MRLIDADDAKRTYTSDMFDTEEDFERVNDVLDYAPTVDAVVVTRCKDCKHYLIADEFDGGKRYMCDVTHFTYHNSDGDMHYCSYGEPKEAENTDDHD